MARPRHASKKGPESFWPFHAIATIMPARSRSSIFLGFSEFLFIFRFWAQVLRLNPSYARKHFINYFSFIVWINFDLIDIWGEIFPCFLVFLLNKPNLSKAWQPLWRSPLCDYYFRTLTGSRFDIPRVLESWGRGCIVIVNWLDLELSGVSSLISACSSWSPYRITSSGIRAGL